MSETTPSQAIGIGNAAALVRAGWHCRERLGKRIWCRDEKDPFKAWYSEDVAYEILRREGNADATI